MAAPEEILADNLKEALKEAQKRIVFGTGAALFLLLLVVQDWWREDGVKTIDVPIVGVSADRTLAGILAAVAYFISGYLASLAVGRAQRIIRRLDTLPQLREAVLMYPSIPTIITTVKRIAALFLPILIFIASSVLVLFMARDKDIGWALLVITFLLSSPYILLIQQLRYPLSEVKYKLTEKSLKDLQDEGVKDEVMKKLKVLKDKEYPNRDRFLDALQGAVGKGQPPPITRLILAKACEEEGLEN